jgi:hypothetical protein
VDTREKILSPAAAAALSPPVLVLGYFDPLTADHARRLEALNCRVTVAILDPPDPLLPVRARAELVAALRCVNHVVLGDPRGTIRAGHVVDETIADQAARQALIDRIVARSA